MYKYRKIKYILGVLLGAMLYIIYVGLSDIYVLLPPLAGILFVIFHTSYNKERFYIVMLVLIGLGFYELNKSLVFGIMPIVFFIVHFFIAKQLESMLNIESNFVVVYVWILYVLYAAGVMLSSMLFKTSILDISIIFVYYAIADSILTLIYSYMFKESKNEKYNNYI